MSLIRQSKKTYDHSGDNKLQRFRDAARGNQKKFIEEYLFIRTKVPGAPLHLLKLNASQQKVWDAIEEQEKANKPVRMVILKSRQVGISTITAAKIFAECYSKDNMYGIISAHDRDVTTNMFRMQHLFRDRLPSELQIPIERSNKQEILWEGTNSIITLTTAGSKHATRSRTIFWYEGSECAFYDDLRETKGAMEASIPEVPGTGIIWETTAFGAGTDFHQLWLQAAAGDINYQALFLKWFDDPQCVYVPSTVMSDKDWAAYIEHVFIKRPEYKDLMKHYSLSREQIAFRFEMLKKYGMDDAKLGQEFPMNPDEAFISSGSPVFPSKLTEQYRLKTKPGELYDPTIDFKSIKTAVKAPHLNRDKDTYLEVWQTPQSGRHYVIPVDPAAGLVTSDPTAAFVIDLWTQSIVAELHGRIDPKTAADMLIQLAYDYNDALIAPETDGLGTSLLSHLKDRYFNIYQWRKPDAFGWKMTNILGWETTEQSRLEMITTARRLFQERQDDPDFIPSAALLSEISTFVHTNLLNRKPSAEQGCHDDRVMAWCIGLAVAIQELKCSPNLAAVKETIKSWLPEDDSSCSEIIRTIKDPRWCGQPLPDTGYDGPFTMGDVKDNE